MVADLCWGECGKKVGSFLCYWLCLWVKKKAGFLWVLGLSSRSFGEIEVMVVLSCPVVILDPFYEGRSCIGDSDGCFGNGRS